MKEFDFVIIGSGMGGLVCGNMLALEGYRVCILEKNKQIGGCLQIFVRDRVIFDSGVHYLGGLEKGQVLYQVFKYLGLMDKLKLEKLDDEGFDRILLDGDPRSYPIAQGYANFVRALLSDFPGEEAALNAYVSKIREVCSRFPLYNLRRGGTLEQKMAVAGESARSVIESLTNNPTLQAVLAGNTMLYAGDEETPFYVHALILNSYIESSWKCARGGSAIAQAMAGNIRNLGGVIQTRSRVERFVVEDERVSAVQLQDGSLIRGKNFISNLHPAKTLDMVSSNQIRNVYRQRLKSLKNTVSVFILNLVFHKDRIPYVKHNYYYHQQGHAWTMADYTEENWPLGYAIYLTRSDASGEFADGMTLFTYMKYEEVKSWEKTFNTTTASSKRGADYEAFKKARAEKLISRVEEKFPGLRESIRAYYTSTPLSFRDYIGTEDGSLYGIAKDYRDPLKTTIPARTKLPNLYLTGQNLNLHGILGAALSGILTCTTYFGNDELIDKIKNA